MSPACRTPNAAIPPTHHPSHGPDRHQRRPTRPRPAANAGNNASGHSPPGRLASCTGPHPVACLPSHRSPGHTPPPNGGFCTIRRIATACRRRVAPLMLQFPPRTTPATAPTATSDDQPGHAPPRTPATTRLATAHPAASPAAPGHTRSPACPATALRATPRRPTGGFAPLDASLQRVAGVSQP